MRTKVFNRVNQVCEVRVISKIRPPGAGADAESTAQLKNNPEIDAKIDSWIKENPERWNYIQALPRERMARALALNEVNKADRREKLNDVK